MPTITLAYRSINLVLGVPGVSPFANGNFPRERLELPTFGRSIAGAVNKEGVRYKSPHSWTISARLTAADSDKLLKIFDLWLEDGASDYIRIHDLIRPVIERGDQTRALAAGASAPVIEGTGAEAIRTYFAQFNGLFADQPTVVEVGARRVVSFVLIEGVKVAP